MIALVINTTIVSAGIVVFLIITLVLVGILLFAKAKLTPKGDVQIDINDGARVLTTQPGGVSAGRFRKPENLSSFCLRRKRLLRDV